MSEKKLSKTDGARLVRNSGRGHEKGDAILEPFCCDYKEYSKSFTINKSDWEKLSSDAWDQSQREPLIALVLDGHKRIAVIDWDCFMFMRNCFLYCTENGVDIDPPPR